MIQPTDLVAALLNADAAERERLLSSVEPTTLEGALVRLGQRREPAAADVLALADQVLDDRALRKLARRELHRLRSVGVQTANVSTAQPAEPSSPRAATPLAVSEAWATDIDPTGSRAIWLLAERALGGVWFAALLVDDTRGLRDLALVDSTRKRFLKEFEASRRGPGTWVDLPGDYALALVREAVDLTRAQGDSLPTRYPALREVFGEAPSAPERALVYEAISPVEINFNPGWLEDSAQLLLEPEVAGWHIPLSADLRERALEVARSPAAGLLVPGHSPEQQALQLLAEVAHQALTSALRRALRRRLEETAYIFLQTDRLAAARLAVAAAQPLAESGAGPRVSVERGPCVGLLLAAGLARLVAAESIGGHPAAEILMELIQRATSERESQGGALETRSSGLILPR